MSEYTEIFGRRIKDLTTPNSELDKTSELVGNIKIPAGNFPTEFSGCEGLRLIDLKNYVYTPVDPEIYTEITKISEDLAQSKIFLNEKITAEEQRAILEESKLASELIATENIINSKINTVESNLEVKIGAVGVGNKAYTTYALMDADKTNIPAKSKVTVTNDATASNNGDWQWDGVVFTKSAYDLLTQAKKSIDASLAPLMSKILTVNSSQYIAISPNLNASGEFIEFLNLATARSCILQVDADSEYVLRKDTLTQSYIVIEHSDFPVARIPNTVIRTINNSNTSGVLNGDINFKTSNNAKWISVTTSINNSESPQLTLVKKTVIGEGFVDSKNIFNPVLKNAGASIAYIDATTNPFTAATNSSVKSAIIPVEKNTQYTLSLNAPTTRFKAILINLSPLGVRNYVNVLDQNGATKVTFTTNSEAAFFALYYTNSSEDPEIQLEKSAQSTNFESYGLKLKFAPDYEPIGFPLTTLNPQYNITAQLKSAFAQSENSIVWIQGGTYEFDQTLNIPSNAKIIGLGKVILKLKDVNSLETVIWRGMNVKTYLKTSESSENSYLENIKVIGASLDTTSLHFGLCMQGTGHELKNVSTDHINWEVTDAAERRTGGNGWGLVFYKAKDCKVKGGRYTYGGYENIGTDNAEDITFENIYCGTGWRTSFQAHRNSKNIVLINPTIEQEITSGIQTHAALTLHGTPTEQVRKLKVIGGTIKANVGSSSPAGRGAIQSVEGNEHDVMLQGVTIASNKNGVVSSTDVSNKVEKWMITGCDIDAVLDTVVIKGKHSNVSGNILKGQRTAQFTGDEATTCIEANNIFIPLD